MIVVIIGNSCTRRNANTTDLMRHCTLVTTKIVHGSSDDSDYKGSTCMYGGREWDQGQQTVTLIQELSIIL